MKKSITKKSIALLIIAIIAMASIFVFIGCKNDNEDENNDSFQTVFTFEQQIDLAKTTYSNFYKYSENKSGLFAESSVNKIAASAFIPTLASSNNTADASDVTLETIRALFIANKTIQTNNSALVSLIKSYISDIFTYSQIQLSLINKYDSDTLVNNYELNYNDIDWSDWYKENISGVNLAWFQSVLLNEASFAGIDCDTNKVYLSQKHKAFNDVNAKVEFYYNSDLDLGVTTLNWHYDSSGSLSRFEYHFCDIPAGMIITATGNASNDINISSFTINSLDGTAISGNFNAADRKIIFDYINAEANRISDKTNALHSENLANAKEYNVVKSETIISHEVSFDFSVLKSMLGNI